MAKLYLMCSTRAEREAARVAVERVGAGYELRWLDTLVEEIKQLLVKRNAASDGSVEASR